MSTQILGIGVSPGRVVGPVVKMPDPITEPPLGETLPASQSLDDAIEAVQSAGNAVKDDLETAAKKATGQSKDVLEATAMMAADPTLISQTIALIREHNTSPQRAVWEAAGEVAEQLLALGGYMAERARDVGDVRNRLIAKLSGLPSPGVPTYPQPFILLAKDLAPADTATLDAKRVLAVVTIEGGPTSHTAILARAIGMPAIVGAADAVTIKDQETVMVDGASGVVTLDPSQQQIEEAQRLASVVRTFDGHGQTSDGHRVQLLANIANSQSARDAAEKNAEGVGLFRTEFCFLDRTEEPSIEEQTKQYAAVFEAFPEKKVVIRTLDAGADKPLPFITNTDEPNPALGVRGLRTSWKNPDVLAHQLEAIAAAQQSTRSDVWVMAPMVATVDEAKAFVDLCAQYGLKTAGVMIEVPAAALLADRILAHAMFASIGTNDLTQYAMASDRLLGELAQLSTAWQPGVLELIQSTCNGGIHNNKPVGVCGEAAADPALAVVLTGLGVTSLSMTARALPDVATVLAKTSWDQCTKLADIALSATSAEEGRAAVRAQLPILDELGL